MVVSAGQAQEGSVKSGKTSKPAKTSKAPEAARVGKILEILTRTYPDATTALDWKSPFQLLVATILSAQCTDERVNQVTPVLFKKYPDAHALGAASPEELEPIIRSTGFFRAKARSIHGAAHVLDEKHAGEVPREMEAMLELPGVARKTANVVLGTAYGLATGVVVDTHVKRVAARLGLTKETAPEKIEQDLMQIIPREAWVRFGHELILHGRALCSARKPKCGECPLAPHCPSAGRVE